MKGDNIYQEHGYYNRTDYLRCMAEDYCVPFDTVRMLADGLGENEDFDGLVTALEDYCDDDWDDDVMSVDDFMFSFLM